MHIGIANVCRTRLVLICISLLSSKVDSQSGRHGGAGVAGRLFITAIKKRVTRFELLVVLECNENTIAVVYG